MQAAVYYRQLKCLQALLQWGADVDALAKDLKTALHIAASKGSSKCLEELLKAGAKPNARDRRGMTPLHYAAEQSYRFIFIYL